MPCEIKLQISNYNSETNQVETLFHNLKTVDKDQSINLDTIAEFISQLNKEERSILAAQLRAAKVQKLTKEMIENYQIISNISIEDLVAVYPLLGLYNLKPDLQHKYILLKCSKAVFNGINYKGRVVNSNGDEIFIINNIYDALKFFKHMSIRLSLDKFIQGNNVDEKLKQYEEDLIVIANKYKKNNIHQLISNYLVDNKAYPSFRNEDKLYNPSTIINKVLAQITGEIFDAQDKSELQIALEHIKEPKSTNSTWFLDKNKLYNTLSTFFKDFLKLYTLEQFKDLDTEALNSVLSSLFANDVKLIKATVKNSTKGEKIIKSPKEEKKIVKVTQKSIQEHYKSKLLPNNPDLPKSYKEAVQKLGPKFKELFKNDPLFVTGKDGVTYTATIEMDENYNVTASYEMNVAPTVKEKPSYITLNLNNWSTIGEIYSFSYADQPLFTHVKQYKGFYIYKYFKNGYTHYAISRSIISPNSEMKTFSNITYAEQFIDTNKDTLEECGLWSIKLHTGRPRVVELEMKKVRVGQIITTLNLPLPPNFKRENFSGYVNNLMTNDVNYFHKKLDFIPNIEELDSPEKAVAFIYLTHRLLEKGENYVQILQEKETEVQEIITQIKESSTVSYLVEKEVFYGNSPKKYYLKLLQNNGTDVSFDGKLGDLTIQDFINQNLTEAINYFKKTFGIKIHAITRSDLEQMSVDNNLGLENKLDVVKAFVYNGEIYINTSNANALDLFHELSHIFLGVLKVKDFQAYQEIINSFVKLKNYPYLYDKHKRTYKHYSELDVVEEVVADMIAEKMFKKEQLVDSNFDGDEFLLEFMNIFKISNRFIQSIPDNGLGFTQYMKTYLEDNTKDMQRNMKISNKVKQLIEEGIIIEKCK